MCRKYGAMIGMTLAAVILLGGCGGNEEKDVHVAVENADETMEYDYLIAEVGDVTVTKQLTCIYRQQKGQEISFAVTGRLVDKVFVKEGEHVKKGDLLAELSVGTLEEQVQDLEYTIARNEMLLEHMELNEALDRSQSWVNYLYNHFMNKEGNEKNLESIGESYRYRREDCEDALELDRAELERVKKELSSCRIYAGMDGLVYKQKEDLSGSTSKAGETVMTIVDDSQCLFEMEEPDYAKFFTEGVPVTLKVSGGQMAGEYELLPYDMEHWGEVQQFSVHSSPTTSGIEVGIKGTVRIVTDSRTQVLCVPEVALNTADGKYFVYVTDEDNIRQIRWVEVGLIGDSLVEIISGLEPGERVVRR